MSFDWWHPESTAICFIIVTIVEIHKLIIDVGLCVQTKFHFQLLLIRTILKKSFGLH